MSILFYFHHQPFQEQWAPGCLQILLLSLPPNRLSHWIFSSAWSTIRVWCLPISGFFEIILFYMDGITISQWLVHWMVRGLPYRVDTLWIGLRYLTMWSHPFPVVIMQQIISQSWNDGLQDVTRPFSCSSDFGCPVFIPSLSLTCMPSLLMGEFSCLSVERSTLFFHFSEVVRIVHRLLYCRFGFV